ncbi:MAG: cyclic pyranopterin monophosphate synthase MoaC, partial [Alphaproteobacteria bacterium]|nr:cyclic pyranopterin monophosphate synthase MoaC [Alphaproteobacteria bacterium]
MTELTHLDQSGAARMVDVSSKPASARAAKAEATIVLSAKAYEAIRSGTAPKGDVLATARIAGIMAAKKTSELIPLCHPLALTSVRIEFDFNEKDYSLRLIAEATTTGQTGVEMEALTAAAIGALAIYDMVKAVDREASIGPVRLIEKSGGKSGRFVAAGRPMPAQRTNKAESPSAPKAGARNGERERNVLRAFMTA